jgi:hypothetical protein
MRDGPLPRCSKLLILLAALLPAAADAGNSLIASDTRVTVARSALTVAPAREWNRLGARPGRNSESWTLDGDTLNDLSFYGGIEDDKPLFRDADHAHRPLPHFSRRMLITDVPMLFESSYRIALQTPLMKVDGIAPATVAGHKGIRFTYGYSRFEEEVARKGEGYAAIVDGRLYMMTFEAPALHYFDAGIADARAVVASARLGQ